MNKDDRIVLKIDAMPVSTNRIWLKTRNGRVYLNPAYKAFKEIVALSIRGLRIPDDWAFCCVDITVFPLRRNGDVDNYIKSTLDALTSSGFWKDDKVVAEVRCRFGAISEHGATLVIVERREKKFFSLFTDSILRSIYSIKTAILNNDRRT